MASPLKIFRVTTRNQAAQLCAAPAAEPVGGSGRERALCSYIQHIPH